MHEHWHGYVKLKYREKLCYMDNDSFMVHIKTEGIYVDIAKDIETRFDTYNYQLERLLSWGKSRKVVELMKHELNGKIITEFAALRSKTYIYLIDDGDKNEKSKRHKKSLS